MGCVGVGTHARDVWDSSQGYATEGLVADWLAPRASTLGKAFFIAGLRYCVRVRLVTAQRMLCWHADTLETVFGGKRA